MLAFRSSVSSYPERSASSALPPARKPTLAIVSTSSKLCGIAAYTAALQRQLDDAFDITIFDLNQYLLRSRHRRVRKLADRHIKEIGEALGPFDFVNLQLEHGTLGRADSDILRRFCWLTDAAPRLSVTFHSFHLPLPFDIVSFAKRLATLKFKSAVQSHDDFRRAHRLSHGIARQLRRTQRRKPVSAIVHNRRDLHDVRYLYDVGNVFDHPLSYLTVDEIEAIRAGSSRRCFPMLDELPADAVLVGVFGFLNEYKGVGTAIEALHHLPANHHLLIFGGIHPQEITARQARHFYISSLFDRAYLDTTVYDGIGARAAPTRPSIVIEAGEGSRDLIAAHPKDLSARIHFMGALDEAEFLTGMAVCDAVVFPYLEVGQSASGPISQALELGCRIIASRTITFLEFAEYHKNAIEFFDIGNHLELAERLLARRQYPPRQGLPDFNVATNRATYLLANSLDLPAGRAAGARQSLVRARSANPARG